MRKQRKYICFYILSFLLVCVFWGGVWELNVSDSYAGKYISQHTGETSWDGGRNRVHALKHGDVLSQSFLNDLTSERMDIFLAGYNGDEMQVKVTLFNDTENRIVYSKTVSFTGERIQFSYEDDIDQICQYTLMLKNISYEPIEVLIAEDDKYIQGDLYINEACTEGDLVFSVYSSANVYRTWLYLSAIVSALLTCLIYLWTQKKYSTEQKWKYCLLVISAIYFILFPPMTIPDEGAHIETAYRYSNQLLGHGFTTEDNQMYMYIRSSDLDLYQLVRENTCTNHIYIREHWEWFSQDSSLIAIDARETSSNFLLYFPCIIGITFGRLLNLGCFPILYIGKICNFLFYFYCIKRAVEIIPMRKNILMVTAFLPMVIHQSVSFSYDATINGAAFLFLALCMRRVYIQKKQTYIAREAIELLYCILVLLTAKGHVYIFILCLLLLMIKNKEIEKRTLYRIISIAVPVIAIMLVFLLWKYVAILDEMNQITDFSGMTYSIAYILSHPIEYLKIFAETVKQFLPGYIVTMVGRYLGWQDITIPSYIVNAFVLILLGAALAKEKSNQYLNSKQKILVGSICALVFFAVIAGLSTARQIGSIIAGVQGRYFIPILPLLLLLCKNNMVVCKIKNDRILIAGEIFLQVLTIVCVLKHIFFVV